MLIYYIYTHRNNIHMCNLQEKLDLYRVKQRRKQTINNVKREFDIFRVFRNLFQNTTHHGVPGVVRVTTDFRTVEQIKIDKTETSSKLDKLPNEEIDVPNNAEQKKNCQENLVIKYTLWFVFFLFWTTLYIIAIKLKFGIVFLMFSALFAIYFNTRTGPKEPNEISAYSVFNKDFRSIDGTLKAEQFEREIRYEAASVL